MERLSPGREDTRQALGEGDKVINPPLPSWFWLEVNWRLPGACSDPGGKALKAGMVQRNHIFIVSLPSSTMQTLGPISSGFPKSKTPPQYPTLSLRGWGVVSLSFGGGSGGGSRN